MNRTYKRKGEQNTLEAKPWIPNQVGDDALGARQTEHVGDNATGYQIKFGMTDGRMTACPPSPLT